MEETHVTAGLVPLGPLSDAQTAAADEQAFRLLYEATSHPLWAYLFHVSGRSDVADDVLQETYCRFLTRKLPVMDASHAKSYLFRIGTNMLHDRVRSELACNERDTLEQESPQSDFTADVEAGFDLRRAMQQLKPRERELLWLAYAEGMSHTEIAVATGLSAISIRLLLFRARRKAVQLLRPQRTSL